MSLSKLSIKPRELKKGILQKRMELSNEVSKKKQEILEKFDKMMKRNKIYLWKDGRRTIYIYER